MPWPARRWPAAVGLALAFVLGSAVPLQASYTKLYRFFNETTSDKNYARVITDGLEVVTATYAEPTAWPSPYRTYMTVSGVLCSSLVFGMGEDHVGSGVVVEPGGVTRVGWSTSDASCRLKDLRWVKWDGTALSAINPTASWGVPGGGYVVEDPVGSGQYTWVITNDTGLPLLLSNLQLEVVTASTATASSSRAKMRAVRGRRAAKAVGSGVAERRFAELATQLDALQAEIEAAARERRVPQHVARSLLAKLRPAEYYLAHGVTLYRAGQLAAALESWQRSAHHVHLFIDKLDHWWHCGQLPRHGHYWWWGRGPFAHHGHGRCHHPPPPDDSEYQQWRAAGMALQEGILALPGSDEATAAEELTAPATVPAAPPAPAPDEPGDPLPPTPTYVSWETVTATETLPAASYTAFSIDLAAMTGTSAVSLKQAGSDTLLVLHGWIEQDGRVVLDWEESAALPTETVLPTTDITPAPDYYDTNGVGHYRLSPGAVTLSGTDTSGIAAMHYGFVRDEEGEEFTLAQGPSYATVTLKPSTRLVYVAEDNAGNVSAMASAVVDEVWAGSAWTGATDCGGHRWLVDAFPSIQQALDAAPAGYTVHVEAGTYYENLTWSTKHLRLIGAGPSSAIINGGGAASCLIMTDVPAGALVQGLGFTNGHPTGTGNPNHWGGGIRVLGGAPTIEGNTFSANVASRGGGVGFWDAAPTITGNTFTSNQVDGYGAGISGRPNAPCTIDGNTISSNTAGAYGGGICCLAGAAVTISHNSITGNSAGSYGGGAYLFSGVTGSAEGNTITGNTGAYGGGLACSTTAFSLTGNTIDANHATSRGGGVYLASSSATLTGNRIGGEIVGGALTGGNTVVGHGGGICIEGGAPTIEDNLIQGNQISGSGGGIYLSGATATIRGNTIGGEKVGGVMVGGNAALGGSNGGGGIVSYGGSSVIEDNDIGGNQTPFGGGIFIASDATPPPALRGNALHDNVASQQGGGIYVNTGSAALLVSGNTISANQAQIGGGLLLIGCPAVIEGNTISENLASASAAGIRTNGPARGATTGPYTIRNNVIKDNAATGTGSGEAILVSYSYAAGTVEGNLIFGNTGGVGTGGILYYYAEGTCRNNTIVGNSGSTCGGVSESNWPGSNAADNPPVIENCLICGNTGSGVRLRAGASAPVVLYSNVYGNTGGQYEGMTDPTGTSGNLSADPLLVSISGGDYHLTSGSPCVDAGNPGASGLPTTDLDGNQRVWNGIVDMGAYEYGSEPVETAGSLLMVSSLSAVPTGVGAQIVFSLSVDAKVSVGVMNIAGRPVRQLLDDRACTRGTNTAAWNCCSNTGLKVPSGTYLVRVTARRADGSQASALCPVAIRR